jgi:AcrR family transcriptional regulator
MGRDPSSGDAARERILDAATTQFAERGFDGVTVGEIAEAADASTSNVFYHFTDKQTLYDRVVDRGIEHFGSAFARLQEGGTARERIESFLHAYMRLVFAEEALMSILVERFRRASHDASDVLVREAAGAIAALGTVISDGIEADEFSPVDPHMAAEALFGMINVRVAALALSVPGGVDEQDPDAVADFLATLFFEGVCSC